MYKLRIKSYGIKKQIEQVSGFIGVKSILFLLV